MNRSYFALFVALLVHLIFLLIFWLLGTIEFEKKAHKKEEKKIKISLKELPKKYKESGQKKQKKPKSKVAPPMPKGSQLKKIVKKQPVKYEPKKEPIEPKLNKPKLEQKSETDIQELDKTVKKENEKKKNPLYSLLSQDHSKDEKKKKKKIIKTGSSIANNIKELYGDKFGELSEAQQKYILDNQEIMRRITQQVLNRVARVNLPNDLNVNKTNVIEFYLHPNGDMTDFKFLNKSGYYILDETTKETIEYAYSRYPRPSEKTLIRYNVFYNLARY